MEIISVNKWIKEGEIYHVLNATKCNVQGGILGFELQEITLGPDELPYKYFDANRFRIPVSDKTIEEEIEELVGM